MSDRIGDATPDRGGTLARVVPDIAHDLPVELALVLIGGAADGPGPRCRPPFAQCPRTFTDSLEEAADITCDRLDLGSIPTGRELLLGINWAIDPPDFSSVETREHHLDSYG